jgi:AraC-like DNA-binding protein
MVRVALRNHPYLRWLPIIRSSKPTHRERQSHSQETFDRGTVAEIGRRAGFSHASHFSKVLRKCTGQTPLQMRRARYR